MSESILQIEQLLSAFGDPEYRFLLLEPLIFYGILIGVFMLGLGYFMKAPKLQIAALITLGISALAHVPYKDARLSAQPRMEQVYKISSPARMKGFNENTQQWLAASWKFRLLVLAATVTVMIGINRNRIGYGLGIATAILGLFAAKSAVWLHYQDAIAYHPNLKKHETPIELQEKEPNSSISVTPSRNSNRAPAPATKQAVAPAALTQPLSTRRPQPSHNTTQYGRVPPPEVPVIGPQPRPVTPLGR